MPSNQRQCKTMTAPKAMAMHRLLVGFMVLVATVALSRESFGVAAAEEEDPSSSFAAAAAAAATTKPPSAGVSLPSITVTDPNEYCRLELLERWRNGIRSGVANSGVANNNARTNGDRGSRSGNTTAIAPLLLSPPSSSSSKEEVLAALARVQDTDLYRSILEDCSYFLEGFHERAETTCNLEQQRSDDSYSTFWDIGPINLDGGILLAVDVLVSHRFRTARPLVPCSDSCYVRDFGGVDCQGATTDGPFLENKLRDMTMLSAAVGRKPRDDDEDDDGVHGKLYDEEILRNDDDGYPSEGSPMSSSSSSSMAWLSSFDQQRTLCQLEWLEADEAYQKLRLCAAESNVARTTIAAREDDDDDDQATDTAGVTVASDVASAYAIQTQRQSECHAAVVSQRVCDAFVSRDQSYGPEIESWIGIGEVDVENDDNPPLGAYRNDPWSGGVTVVVANSRLSVLLATAVALAAALVVAS